MFPETGSHLLLRVPVRVAQSSVLYLNFPPRARTGQDERIKLGKVIFIFGPTQVKWNLCHLLICLSVAIPKFLTLENPLYYRNMPMTVGGGDYEEGRVVAKWP